MPRVTRDTLLRLIINLRDKTISFSQGDLKLIVEAIRKLGANDNFTDEEEDATFGVWEDLKINSDYEINTIYPYHIRNKQKLHRYLKKATRNSGFITVSISDKPIRKDIIVAHQWLNNPDKMTKVEHVNNNRADYHLDNLRIVPLTPPKKISKNKKKVEINETTSDVISEPFD
jgi:hypothetical protein